MKPTNEIKKRLEELRERIRAENISYGEIAELQGLAEHIEPGDVELLQWAGVPEPMKQDTRTHTPGPWWISDNGSELRPEAIHGSPSNAIVATTWSIVGTDERKANARLIAAAPELLEALEATRSSVKQWEGSAGIMPSDRYFDSLLNVIDTALAKVNQDV